MDGVLLSCLCGFSLILFVRVLYVCLLLFNSVGYTSVVYADVLF